MSACDHFIQNAWRPDLCSTCQRAKSEHNGSTGPRSWRRKSEPNPNNAITGVRISALASKFQAQDETAGSTPDSDAERAKTLDRKLHRSRDNQINKCLSAELLDSPNSSSTSSSSLSSSTSTSTSAISTSDHHPAERKSNPRHIKTDEVKSKNHLLVSRSLSLTTNSHTKSVSETLPEKTGTVKPPQSTSSITNNKHGAVKTSAVSSVSARVGSQLPTSGLSSAATKSNSSRRSGSESSKKHYVAHSSIKSTTTAEPSSLSSSILKIHQAGTVKETLSSKEKVLPSKEKRRVSIPNLEPEVIGHDGGLDNLFPEEESVSGEDSDHIYLSLTDEEKQFALLALGNTVWNSDTRNLQVEADAAKRSCREFEDLSVDQLLTVERFSSLLDCDAINKRPDSGTFPQISNSKLSKASIKNISFSLESRVRGSREGSQTTNGVAEGTSVVDSLKSSSLGSSVVKTSSSDGGGRKNNGPSYNSADSGVEVGGNNRVGDAQAHTSSYTVSDITDSLYKSPDNFWLDGQQQSLGEKNSCDPIFDSSVQVSSQPKSPLVNSGKSQDSGQMFIPDKDDPNITMAESAVEEGLQAVDLLNDVLKDYGDSNESSTDDFGARNEPLKGKKSSDFEARMASVAATLDLAKQQRGKRPAPRPPVSPPPEPDLTDAISPKKTFNQPDPVFKMVTVGKSIITLPPQQDMSPQNSKPSIVSYGLDDFGSLTETTDSNRTNGDVKSKKGITSFFRNILRRGKDSSDSFESSNPDVQLNVRVEKDTPAATSGSIETTNSDPSSTLTNEKLGPTSVARSKVAVLPQISPFQEFADSDCMVSGENGGDDCLMSELSTARSASSVVVTSESPVSASPPVQRKTSKGLGSPKLMLRKTAAKYSPPNSHSPIKPPEKELDGSSLTVKPYPAPKPGAPSQEKPASTSEIPPSDATVAKERRSSSEFKESTPPVPNVVHRRAKSPKRTAPPVPSTRTCVVTGKAASSEARNVDLTKELEWRLKKTTAEQSEGGTLSRTELRESTRRSLPIPPSPPGEKKEKKVSTAGTSESPTVSPIREKRNSLPSSPSSPTGISFDFVPTEWSGGSTSTIDDDMPKFAEKIELPTVATQSRKGFLGKLAGNRKSRAPQPPVKRAMSITQSSTLPRGEKKSKKINVADISGPVMVNDVTNGNVLGNRRNTISLGDEPAFVAMSASCLQLGSAGSSSSFEKGGFDEFDFPVLSPLGSLENLYESVLPKPEGILFNYYDPPTSPKVFCPSIPTDGYLEPVPPLSLTATGSATTLPSLLSSQSTSLSVSLNTATNLSSSSSTSSTSSATTNASVVKSPFKSQTSSSRIDRAPNISATKSKDPGSCNSTHTISSSSSETNSTENSGSSNPDSSLIISESPVSDKSGTPFNATSSSISSGLGPHFVEPEMTEQRRILLASQPIYEEIPSGGDEEMDDYEDDKLCARRESERTMDMSSKCSAGNVGCERRNMLPPAGTVEVTKSQVTHSWLQLQQSHFVTQTPLLSSPSILASNGPSAGTVQSSPSRGTSKQNPQPLSSALSMSSSQLMSSSLMSTSLTSSMLPPPPPPPEQPLAQNSFISDSVSQETVSSESDTQSNCSYDTQSNCSTLSRPRPAPRRRPKRHEAGVSDQYVSMNRPNAQVSLSEDRLRDVFTKLTSITFHALQDIYAQCEKMLSVSRLDISSSRMLKWADFEIFGQPLHASARCVAYNARLRITDCLCQIMILHSRPATEMCTSSHPSLLHPSAVFADTIPFSYLTPDFIKTSQLLQNSVYDSSQARCFVAVGAFDIVENLDSYLTRLRENLTQDVNSYLNVILTAALQLLSAMSHCLDQGFSVTETDYSDIFLITRSDLHGKVVSFLPRQRSLDVPQGEAMCNFLDRLLAENMPDDEDDDHTDDDDEEDKIISSPKKVVMRLRSLLEPKKVECLGQVRTAVEYLLWGPAHSELLLSPSDRTKARSGGASQEQELYVWLEKERLSTVGRLARNVAGLRSGVSLEEFYTLKFLLKTSAGCLAESCRQLTR